MKKLFTILLAFSFAIGIFSQSPEKMSYQAVVRGVSNELITEQAVGMQISILQGSASGTAVYVETQNPTTNGNGLVSIEIGAGTVVSGDFATIDWSNGPYFIKTETDPDGGSTYSITGTSQLLSVPYALHSGSSDVLTGVITESQISDLQGYLTEETDPSVPLGTQTGEIQYWNGTAWITVAAGNEGQVLTLTGGVPTWVSIAAYQLSSTEVYNPTTGEIWMDRNLGATQVATSSTDYLAYGDLYQWGRASDGHQTIVWTSSTTSDGAEQAYETTTLSGTDTPGHGDFILAPDSPYDWRNPQNDNLWQGASGTNNPCPSGYRLPTEAEWEAERTSWSSNNAAGAFASPLKLPVAGLRRYSDGSLYAVGYYAYYWSSTVDGTNSQSLNFSSSGVNLGSNRRAHGCSVRCLKD